MTPNFEEILLELSYRVPTGIVDLTNEEHLDELVTILEENRIYNSQAINTLKEKAVKSKTSSDGKTLVVNKQSGAVYAVQRYNPNTQTKATPKDIQKAKASGKFGKAEPAKPTPNVTIKQTDAEKKLKAPATTPKTPTRLAQTPVNVNLNGTLDDVLGRFDDSKNTANSVANVKQAVLSVSNQLKIFAKVKGNPYANEHLKVDALLTGVFNGKKLSDNEQKLVAKYVRVAEPTDANPNACKIYIAREPDNFTSQGPKKRERIYVGAKDKSTPVIGAFRQWTEKNGVPMLATSTFGGKKTTANQTYLDKAGKTRILKNVTSVKEGKDGKVASVKIGNLNIIRMNPAEARNPNEKKRIEKNNRTLDEYAEKIKANDMDFIDMDNGVVPDSPKNRVVVIQQSISGMANRFKQLADKAFVGDKETLELINDLERFSKKDPNKNPKEWLEQFENHLSKIANHNGEPSLKEGWANYAEIFVAIREMHDNGKGTQNGKCALLPQSTTLETVDVVTISDGKGENRIVTLNGRSVKKGVGGASALTSKCRKSKYKNDPKGVINKGVIELSESHTKPYALSMNKPLSEHKKLNTEYQKYLKEKAKQLNVSPKDIIALEKDTKTSGGRGFSKINSAYQNILLERKKAGLDVGDDTMQKVKMRLESYYMYSELAHEAYNTNVDVQDFSNDSVLSQKEDRGGAALARAGRIAIDSSDGIDILAYPKPEFNIGFTLDGKSKNPGAGRFHNEKKRI
jgi:hypothetical protein